MSILEKLKRRQAEKVAESSAYDTSSSYYPNNENYNSENSLRKTHHRKSLIEREKKLSSSSSSDNQISLIQRSRMQEQLFAQNCNEQRRSRRPANFSNSASSPYSNSNGRVRDNQHCYEEECSTVTAGLLHLRKPLVNSNNDFYYEDRGRMAPMDWNQINDECSPTKSVTNGTLSHHTPKPLNKSTSSPEVKSNDGMLNFIKNTKTTDTIYKVKGNVDLYVKSNDSPILKIQKMRDRNFCNNLQVDTEINEMFSVEAKPSQQPHENGISDVIDDIDLSESQTSQQQMKGRGTNTSGDVSSRINGISGHTKNAVDENKDHKSNISSSTNISKIQSSSSVLMGRSRVDETDDDAFKFVKQVAEPVLTSPSTSSMSARSSSSSEKFKNLTRKAYPTNGNTTRPFNSVREEVPVKAPQPRVCQENDRKHYKKASSRVIEDDDAFVYQTRENRVALKHNQSICSAMDSDDMSLDRSSIFENSSVFPSKYEEIEEELQSPVIENPRNDSPVKKTPVIEVLEPDQKESWREQKEDSKNLSPEYFSKYFTKLRRKLTVDIAHIVENNDDFIPSPSNELLKPVATRYFSDKKILENSEQEDSRNISLLSKKTDDIVKDCNISLMGKTQSSKSCLIATSNDEKLKARSSAHVNGIRTELSSTPNVMNKTDSCVGIVSKKSTDINSGRLNTLSRNSNVQAVQQRVRKIRGLTSSPRTNESRSNDSYTNDSLDSVDSQAKSNRPSVSLTSSNSDDLNPASLSPEVENIQQKNYITDDLIAPTEVQEIEKVHSHKSDSLDSFDSRKISFQQRSSPKISETSANKFNTHCSNTDEPIVQENMDSDMKNSSDSLASRAESIQIEGISSSDITKTSPLLDAKIDHLQSGCDIAPALYDSFEDDNEGTIRFGYSNSKSTTTTVIQTLDIPSDSDPNESLDCNSNDGKHLIRIQPDRHDLDEISNNDSSEDSDVDCITISTCKKEGSSVVIQEIDDVSEIVGPNEQIETVKSVSPPSETMKHQVDLEEIDSEEEFDVVGFENTDYFEQIAHYLGVTDLYNQVRSTSSSPSQQLEIM
ncbi:hypothetical protein QAD02_010942 [Eretmocerus hayati]|uniref:Uncharacterized protein n=1 Tax=Eretmocerus hayati TaxID=131215 RepID=A0ACC2NVI0_9HYME|nr:hypothetical protein QAD02_010942 [Eretmocerus hayati]